MVRAHWAKRRWLLGHTFHIPPSPVICSALVLNLDSATARAYKECSTTGWLAMSGVNDAQLQLDPQSAIERWCNKELVAEARRLREIGSDGVTLAAIIGEETPSDRANDPLCRVLDQLSAELHPKLLDGVLIAAGYVSGDRPDAPRFDVEASRWSVLRIDFEHWRAEGSGIGLDDLRIREPSQTASTLPARGLTIKRQARSVEWNGTRIPLADQPFRLLQVLAEAAYNGLNTVLPNRRIEDALWGNYLPKSRPVRDVVRELRHSEMSQ